MTRRWARWLPLARRRAERAAALAAAEDADRAAQAAARQAIIDAAHSHNPGPSWPPSTNPMQRARRNRR